MWLIETVHISNSPALLSLVKHPYRIFGLQRLVLLALQLESYAEGLDHVIVLRYKFACTGECIRLSASSSPLHCGFILSSVWED